MPAVLTEELFFPSRRPSQRLERKSAVILDVEEATGAPRLTSRDLFDPKSRNGLFCANNPVNWRDPYGLNIQVAEFPASIWGVDYNHVGIHVTGMPVTQGWTVGKYPSSEHSPWGDAVVKPDTEAPIPGRDVEIPTTIEQDEAAIAYIESVQDDAGDYTFWDENCTRFVEGVLKAAGLPNVPTSVAPGSLINKLKKQYDKGPFADVHVTLRNGGGGGGGFGLGGGGGLLGVGTVMWGGEPWGAGVSNGNVIIDWKNVKAYKKG